MNKTMVSEEFDFERESEYMTDRGFTLCDDDDYLRWVPGYSYTLAEQQQLEDELFELYKDNQYTGVPHPISWDEYESA